MSEADPTLWPPPPLHPSVNVLEIGRVRVVRTQIRLTLTNLAAKRALWFGTLSPVLVMPFAMLMVKITMFLNAKTTAGREYSQHLFSTMLHSHVLQSIFFCEMVALFLWSWFCYTRFMYKGLFVLDEQRGTFQGGGKDFYPLSELETVRVQPFVAQQGKRWLVQIVQAGGDPRPRWRQLLTYPARPDITQVAAFRKREDAEQLAALIAEFAGVELQCPLK